LLPLSTQTTNGAKRLFKVDFPDKEIIPQDFRLLMRSRHIYILFSGFIHLLLGVYLQIEARV
jgi:hypothetical protein